MTGEIISVGTELLLGQIVNTDAQYLSQQLSGLGINLYHQITVGDNEARLIECIEQAAGRSDLIILSGGLGPTLDDMTKQTLAKYLGLQMIMDEAAKDKLEKHFNKNGFLMTPNNLRQAEFPQGAKILPNDKGTAPGCIVESGGKIYVVLPGPPFELKDMFQKQVRPFLEAQAKEKIVSKMLRIFGVGESRVETELRDLIDAQVNPTIAPYAGFGEVVLRLTVKCQKDEDAEAMIAPVEEEIRRRLGKSVYGTGDKGLDQVVAAMLYERGVTISLAESCTGGMVTSALVACPGISDVLLEGIVTYSDQSKTNRLGVPAELIREVGAVSPEVARAMARGQREKTGSQLAVSTTGIAGPGGGSEKKPVGLVYVGISDEKGEDVHELRLHGDRDRVRKMTTLHVLYDIYLRLLEQ